MPGLRHAGEEAGTGNEWRKQLKQYGKTAKGELERLESDKKALEEELQSSLDNLSDATDKLAEAHEEILRLQSQYAASQESVVALQKEAEKREASSMMAAGTLGSPAQHRRGGSDVDKSHDDDEHARRMSTLSMDDGWQQMGDEGDDDDEMRDSFADGRLSAGEPGLDGDSSNNRSSSSPAPMSGSGGISGEKEHFKDGKWVSYRRPSSPQRVGSSASEMLRFTIQCTHFLQKKYPLYSPSASISASTSLSMRLLLSVEQGVQLGAQLERHIVCLARSPALRLGLPPGRACDTAWTACRTARPGWYRCHPTTPPAQPPPPESS